MSEDADRFRQESEKCLRLAAQAVNPHDREALLRIAAEWLRLALRAEHPDKLH